MSIDFQTHIRLQRLWVILLHEDLKTYQKDFFDYQNKKLKQFLKEEMEKRNVGPEKKEEIFDKFNTEIHPYENFGYITESDKVKILFSKEPGHEKWNKIIYCYKCPNFIDCYG